MKQILYKVWDFEQNCWIEDSKGFDSWSMAPQGYIELWENTCTKEFVHEGLSGHLIEYNNDRFDILLWTGKETEAGEKIYDGHIVHITGIKGSTVAWNRNTKGIVKWCDESHAYYIVDLDRKHSWGLYKMDIIEIIGHKHTHPELLKEIK